MKQEISLAKRLKIRLLKTWVIIRILENALIAETNDEVMQGGAKVVNTMPLNRPTTSELYEKLETWISAIDSPDPSELSEELSNLKKSKFDQQNIHSEAFYTSKFLYFP
ncbi:430_t:CDS:2 [Funneliformis caledonium]|uniref:430_t:CDS:1 n=1 Tax=Funneliformis caledonium TaxID=1117310 RepID=A0A9N9AKM0_9GLOM|nr:430_t:CDS:2 [Funneliformis caledonium]